MIELELNEVKLRVYEDGKIEYYHLFYKKWCKASEKPAINGYKRISLNEKKYYQHRIIGFAFLGLDINNPELEIDHRNRIRHDNRIENLRIVNRIENLQNTNAKGYYKEKNGWEAYIHINGKRIYKRFKIEEEAKQWRNEMKALHYIQSNFV